MPFREYLVSSVLGNRGHSERVLYHMQTSQHTLSVLFCFMSSGFFFFLFLSQPSTMLKDLQPHLNNNTSKPPTVQTSQPIICHCLFELFHHHFHTMYDETFKNLSWKWDPAGWKRPLYWACRSQPKSNFSPTMQHFDQSIWLIEDVTTYCLSLPRSPPPGAVELSILGSGHARKSGEGWHWAVADFQIKEESQARNGQTPSSLMLQYCHSIKGLVGG